MRGVIGVLVVVLVSCREVSTLRADGSGTGAAATESTVGPANAESSASAGGAPMVTSTGAKTAASVASVSGSGGAGGAQSWVSATNAGTSTGSSACDSGQMGAPSAVWCKQCQVCARSSVCEAAVATCQNDPECVAYYQCAQIECGPVQCPECAMQHPEGALVYEALINCLGCACVHDCGVFGWADCSEFSP